MVEVGRFVEELKAAGIGLFVGVPDSLLKSFCAYVTDICIVKNATPPLLLHHFYSTNGVRPSSPMDKVSAFIELKQGCDVPRT